MPIDYGDLIEAPYRLLVRNQLFVCIAVRKNTFKQNVTRKLIIFRVKFFKMHENRNECDRSGETRNGQPPYDDEYIGRQKLPHNRNDFGNGIRLVNLLSIAIGRAHCQRIIRGRLARLWPSMNNQNDMKNANARAFMIEIAGT